MRLVFYNQQINKVTPISFSCTGLKTQIPMHSNSIGCPKIFPPVCSSFALVNASDMHLEPESENEPESEKRVKNVDFHTAKNIQIQATLFRYF